MLKNKIRRWCQQLIGIDRYLFLFARFSIFRIRYLGHEKEFRHFLHMLSPQGNILDIGANIGTMTVLLAQACPQARVLSFEPVPATARILQKVKACFGLANIEVYETALGQTDGALRMRTPLLDKALMQGSVMYAHHPEGQYRTIPSGCL